MKHLKRILHDEAATMALGAAMVRILSPGLVVYLHGELGTGKTALTRALLHSAGHQGHVKSPTYALMESYSLDVAGTQFEVRHFDLYRLANANEFLEAGFRDEFDGQHVCIVEWPEKAAGVLQAADIAVYLQISGKGREVELKALSDLGVTCLDRLRFLPNL